MLPSGYIDTFARDRLPARDQWPDLPMSVDTQYPDRLNVAVELLDHWVRAGHGERIALRHPEHTWSYADLARKVDAIAWVLTETLGLKPGERVLLRGFNHPMMAACWFAVIKAGLIAVATMPLLRAKELTQIIDKAQVKAALCDHRLMEELRAAQQASPVLAQVRCFNAPADDALGIESLMAGNDKPCEACDTAQDDVALIAFTSGTTGQPKGTLHFHRDVLAMCDLFPRHVLKPHRDDVFCGTPPLAFTFGLGGMLCFPMRVGASTLLLEKLTPQSLLEAIAEHRTTVCFTAPTFYRQMAPLASRFDLSSLKKCVSAGEALPDATRVLWREATGIELIDGIGATEMIHIFISVAETPHRAGALGKVIPGYEAKIVDEAMRELPPGEVGKLAVRGPTGCRYLDDERQSKYVRDGWNLPGDAFRMDADGYFYYQARTDDMIISAGYNIAGPEVEACLMEHPAVAECGVIGQPDAERGQIVRAFVVLRPGHAPSPELVKTLQDFVKAQIAPYKYPREIEFRDNLPRTETGKLQRFRLRT